jgi:hypothetical protein
VDCVLTEKWVTGLTQVAVADSARNSLSQEVGMCARGGGWGLHDTGRWLTVDSTGLHHLKVQKDRFGLRGSVGCVQQGPGGGGVF